jgi:hypothetical protein
MVFGLIVLVIDAAVSCTPLTSSSSRRSGSPAPSVSHPSESPSRRSIVFPEGVLLALGGGGPLLFAPGSNDPVALAPGFVGYDISPDGSQVVATLEERLGTGISYNPDLVLIDTKTHRRTLLARTAPREEFNGPVRWSPDGTAIAYNLVRYAVNPADDHPGPHPDLQTICVIELETRQSTCFPELRRVYDFDWSPDGQSLLVTGPGPLSMMTLSPATGDVSSLVAMDDAALTEKLKGSGLGRAVQFLGPRWSPSGAYIAVWVNAPLPVPAIFTRSGDVVAVGKPALGNAYELSWWPQRDKLLYTTGYSLEEPRPWVLRELDPSSKEDRPLVAEPSRPLTTDFIVSPSGRWLGILRWSSYSHQEVLFIDLTKEGQTRQWSTIALSSSVSGLEAWERSP